MKAPPVYIQKRKSFTTTSIPIPYILTVISCTYTRPLIYARKVSFLDLSRRLLGLFTAHRTGRQLVSPCSSVLIWPEGRSDEWRKLSPHVFVVVYDVHLELD